MKIKPITNKQHIVYCSWCKAEGVRAVCLFHLTHANRQSCAYHLPKLEEIKAAQDKLDKQEPSEADQQTWMRL